MQLVIARIDTLNNFNYMLLLIVINTIFCLFYF